MGVELERYIAKEEAARRAELLIHSHASCIFLLIQRGFIDESGFREMFRLPASVTLTAEAVERICESQNLDLHDLGETELKISPGQLGEEFKPYLGLMRQSGILDLPTTENDGAAKKKAMDIINGRHLDRRAPAASELEAETAALKASIVAALQQIDDRPPEEASPGLGHIGLNLQEAIRRAAHEQPAPHPLTQVLNRSRHDPPQS